MCGNQPTQAMPRSGAVIFKGTGLVMEAHLRHVIRILDFGEKKCFLCFKGERAAGSFRRRFCLLKIGQKSQKDLQ